MFFLVLWKQRLRKSIGFYDINHYHKPELELRAERIGARGTGTTQLAIVGFNLKFVPLRIFTIQLFYPKYKQIIGKQQVQVHEKNSTGL